MGLRIKGMYFSGYSYCYIVIVRSCQYLHSHLQTYLPAIRTEEVYLYLLNSKYSRISSLISIFSLLRVGLASDWSSKALNTSARILALIWLRTPLFSSVSLTTESKSHQLSTHNWTTNQSFFFYYLYIHNTNQWSNFSDLVRSKILF